MVIIMMTRRAVGSAKPRRPGWIVIDIVLSAPH
jgi:hypothetical protein